mmetsp:Transcript_8126/g.16058  ORF Transcript_8126/g.16058 Transcript_8126/m.16058 type:complete len:392 (+) Transcript_8126:536-1711(+)
MPVTLTTPRSIPLENSPSSVPEPPKLSRVNSSNESVSHSQFDAISGTRAQPLRSPARSLSRRSVSSSRHMRSSTISAAQPKRKQAKQRLAQSPRGAQLLNSSSGPQEQAPHGSRQRQRAPQNAKGKQLRNCMDISHAQTSTPGQSKQRLEHSSSIAEVVSSEPTKEPQSSARFANASGNFGAKAARGELNNWSAVETSVQSPQRGRRTQQGLMQNKSLLMPPHGLSPTSRSGSHVAIALARLFGQSSVRVVRLPRRQRDVTRSAAESLDDYVFENALYCQSIANQYCLADGPCRKKDAALSVRPAVCEHQDHGQRLHQHITTRHPRVAALDSVLATLSERVAVGLVYRRRPARHYVQPRAAPAQAGYELHLRERFEHAQAALGAVDATAAG